MKTANELLQQRAKNVADMRDIIDKAEKENRDFSAEELEMYNKMEADVDTLKQRADRIENAAKLESNLDKIEGSPAKVNLSDSKKNALASAEYSKAFEAAIRKDRNGLSGDILNALQVGTDSEGGFITAEEFDTMIVAARQDINEIRDYATVITTGSDRNIPTESSLGTATWTAEEAAYTESDTAFGQVVLGAHKLGTIVKVSEELLQDAFFDVQSYLAGVVGKRFGLAEETAYVNGDGSGKPTGIVQGSTLGKTFATNAAITALELVDVYHALSRPYRNGATWMFNDSTAKLIRKLVDGNSQFMWQPGLVAGQPDTLLGRPILVSSAMPAVATVAKSVIFGDLSGYTIADRRGTVVQRLNELYAANGQVGFRAYERTEGKVTDSSAIIHGVHPV